MRKPLCKAFVVSRPSTQGTILPGPLRPWSCTPGSQLCLPQPMSHGDTMQRAHFPLFLDLTPLKDNDEGQKGKVEQNLSNSWKYAAENNEMF